MIFRKLGTKYRYKHKMIAKQEISPHKYVQLLKFVQLPCKYVQFTNSQAYLQQIFCKSQTNLCKYFLPNNLKANLQQIFSKSQINPSKACHAWRRRNRPLKGYRKRVSSTKKEANKGLPRHHPRLHSSSKFQP